MAQWPSIYFVCEALVDQDKYIGQDPVGYRCMRRALFEVSEGKNLLCEHCYDLFQCGSSRIILNGNGGRKSQQEYFRNVFLEMTR